MSITFKPSFGVLPLNTTASGDMHISGNLVVDGVLTAAGISGSGEANTASNVGGGTGVFKGKTGVDLEFKSLVGSGITINSKTSTIELTASGGGSTNPGGSDTQVQFNQNGSFAGDSGFTYDGSGSVSFGSAASDTHQVTGTLAISGTQPATFYGPEGTGGSAAIIAAHTSSIDDWQSPISGALVVSADIGLGGTGNRGAAVLYVHSQGTESRLGFKNSSTLVSGEQKNQVTAANAGGAYVGLTSTQLDVRNEIGDVLIQADASGEILVSGDGTRIGNNANDSHTISGSLAISGSQTGLLHVRGDVTASNNISASAFYGDGSNLQNVTGAATPPGGSNTQIQFNDDGSFAGSSTFTFATGSNTLTVTNLTASSVEINGGTIEGSDITVGAGKTLDVSNGTLTLALNQISGDSINGGTIDSITIETLSSTSVTASSAEISAGTIDGTTIGGTTPASGTFTTVSASLMQNTYYSASINSNTSVPTNQYNFINYQLGASLALTASSPVAGASYIILLRQDATGGRVVSFDSATFKFPSGSNTTNSTGSNDVDIVTGISDGSVIYAALSKKFV
jgi:hypothetical protein